MMRSALVFLVLALACKQSPASNLSEGAVAVTVDQDGFKPTSVSFRKGKDASLVFTRKVDETCATEVVFPELGIKKALPKVTPVSVTIPTDKERSLTFQ